MEAVGGARRRPPTRSGGRAGWRSSVARWPGSVGRTASGASQRTADSGNTRPMTDAGSTTARSSRPSRSSRAASSAWMVGGTGISPTSSASRQSPSTRRIVPVVDEHRHELLDEQRVALGRADDHALADRSAASPTGRAAPRRSRRPGRRPAGRGRSAPARSPSPQVGRVLEQVVAGRAQDQHRAGQAGRRDRCSSRSSRVGSAQWMSSITRTSGPRSARISTSRRTAQNSSASGNAVVAQAGRRRRSDRPPPRRRRARGAWPGPVGRVVLVDVGRRAGRSRRAART